MTRPRGAGEWDMLPNWVYEAIAFASDGRPVCRVASGDRPGLGADPMSPIVIAFQGMIADGLGGRGRPVSAVYGDRVLSLVPGRLVHVATVVRGRPDHELRASMEAAVRRLEAHVGAALDGWTGDPAEVEGAATELAPVVGRTADRTPGEVEDPLVTRGVFPVSAVDFAGGRARLRVGVFSAGFATLSGGLLELTYSREALRLEATSPEKALAEGGSVRLPVVAPGEAGSVACLMEPLVPGRHLVEGTLTFFDDAGNPRHLEMPRREFEVTFPGLSLAVPPSGDIATVGAALDEAVRTWTFPASLGGLDVFRSARTVLGTRGLVLSPGSEEEGLPPHWSSEGRGMAGRTPLMVGIDVTGGDARRLELRVRSIDPAVTAGALVEMRRLISEAFFRRWRGQVVLEEELKAILRPPEPPPTDIDIYVSVR